MGVPLEVANRVAKVKEALHLESNGDAIQVALTALDIINGTGYGGWFTEAVKAAMEKNRVK